MQGTSLYLDRLWPSLMSVFLFLKWATHSRTSFMLRDVWARQSERCFFFLSFCYTSHRSDWIWRKLLREPLEHSAEGKLQKGAEVYMTLILNKKELQSQVKLEYPANFTQRATFAMPCNFIAFISSRVRVGSNYSCWCQSSARAQRRAGNASVIWVSLYAANFAYTWQVNKAGQICDYKWSAAAVCPPQLHLTDGWRCVEHFGD